MKSGTRGTPGRDSRVPHQQPLFAAVPPDDVQVRGTRSIELSASRNLAVIETRARAWTAARGALADADALARRMGHPRIRDELAYDRGRLALAEGRLDVADRELVLYLATLDSSQHVFRHDTRIRLAVVHARRGDLERAEREALEAWDELERWRAGLSDAELRRLTFQASASEANDADAIVVHLLAALAAGGRAERAFELAERRRARELMDRLQRAAAWRGSTFAAGAGRPTLGALEVAERIPDDSTAVLEYVAGALGAPTILFVMRRRGDPGSRLRAYVLPAADSLTPDIRRLGAALERGEPLPVPTRRLGAALVEPALRDLGPQITRLVVVPDGRLHAVPFDVLRAGGRYLVESYAVSFAPSASVVAGLWQAWPAERRGEPVRLLAFGNPAPAWFDSSLPSLPGAAAEAKTVARFADDAHIRLGPEASAAYLKRSDLSRYRVIHFASHALVDENVAARTALVLAPGGAIVVSSRRSSLPPSDSTRISSCSRPVGPRPAWSWRAKGCRASRRLCSRQARKRSWRPRGKSGTAARCAW